MTKKWLTRFAAIVAVALLETVATAQGTPEAEKNQPPAPTSNSVKPDSPLVSGDKADSKPHKDSQSAMNPAGGLGQPVIRNRKDKISYAFGVNLGRDMQRQQDELNIDLLVRALTDTLNSKPLIMTDEEVAATLKKVDEEQKQDYEHARMMTSEKNRKAGEAFFAENAKKDDVVTLPSGLQYKILKKGDGKLPMTDDKVVCQFRATLLDGIEVDSSEKRGHPVTLPVKGIMAGWTQALQMMPVGSKWQLFIPPHLAYGDKMVNGIEPNATLIVDVELLSIQDRTQTASAAK